MDLWTIAFRTVVVYFFLLIVFRMMGKREIGELSVLDFVIAIMIAEMAVTSIEDTNITYREAFTPILLLSFLQIILAYWSLKSRQMRYLLDGKPTYLINEGKIDEKAMKKQRYNFDDLLVQIRQKDVKDVSDVEFAILEPSGELSVFEKQEETEEGLSSPLPLIMDGCIEWNNLQQAGKDELWLRREIHKAGIDNVKQVSYCALQQDGVLYIDEKDD
ncbi:DUF421 domain-containing protein [Salibacterium salarium]|uniref:DUF421 domain-containing protein n=1 Tax=Salibacterium salarium TaxID=284579 RepID=A0A3R9PXN0_9BACI|nr:DUF421 domain-containing protein [Salibacterium salarium]RSL29248.1 DUF421 domain-containing protein [Salibacterium salarium]